MAVILAVAQFVEDLQRQRSFRKGLRVKGIKGASGIFEMTWAADGRATFEYGASTVPGEPHVIWRRAGTHEIVVNALRIGSQRLEHSAFGGVLSWFGGDATEYRRFSLAKLLIGREDSCLLR